MLKRLRAFAISNFYGLTWAPRLLLVFFFLSFNLLASESLPYELKPDSKSSSLKGHVEHTVVDGKQPFINDFQIEQLNQQNWELIQSEVPNLGFSRDTHWLRFKISNRSAKVVERRLSMNYPVLDRVNAYVLSQEKENDTVKLTTYRFGDSIPFNSRPIFNRNFIVPLSFLPYETKSIYLQVQSDGSVQVPIFLLSENELDTNEQSYLLIQGVYFGVMLVMSIYYGMLYFSIKESIFLYFSISIFNYAIFQSAMNGIGFQFVWPHLEEINSWIIPFSLSAFDFFASVFMMGFLRLKQRNRTYFKIMKVVAIICATIAITSPFSPYSISTALASILAAPLAILALWISAHMFINGIKSVRYFLIGWIIFVGFSIMMALNKWGVIPRNNFTEHSVQLGSFIAALFLSLALADRIRVNQIKRQNAQRQAMLERRKARIAKEQNQELEMLAREKALDAKEKVYRAEAESKAKSDFLATMSHEIRTPMNGVLGVAKILADTELNEKQKEYLKIIESSGNSLLTIINDILDYSKIEAGKMELEKISFNLEQLCEDTLRGFYVTSDEQSIELSFELDKELPDSIIADPNRIRQILNNLLGNAFKFTEKGKVILRIIRGKFRKPNEASTTLCFQVVDTGIGISDSQRKKLFKEFSQADSSTTRKFGGTGLGLSISKKLVELMQGEIGIESEEGSGTTFWFTLPLIIPKAETLANAKEVQQDDHDNQRLARLKGKRALVAEDNSVNQMVIKNLLQKLGVTAEVVDDGLQAIEQYKENKNLFDFVLMDCEMPKLDGYQAASIIREFEKLERLNPVPIIAVTAHALEEHQQHSIESGMNTHISKPIQRSKLIAALSNFIEE